MDSEVSPHSLFLQEPIERDRVVAAERDERLTSVGGPKLERAPDSLRGEVFFVVGLSGQPPQRSGPRGPAPLEDPTAPFCLTRNPKASRPGSGLSRGPEKLENSILQGAPESA